MKKLYPLLLTFCLFASSALVAQDSPTLLSVSVAGEGVYVNWAFLGEDENAIGYQVLQMQDEDFVAVHSIEDISAGYFLHEDAGAADAALTYAVALLYADEEIGPLSDAHTTVFVSTSSEDCDDPILIEWTPYIGLGDLSEGEHTIFKGAAGSAQNSEVAIVAGDVFAYEYALEEDDEGVLSFSIQTSPDGFNKMASNIIEIDSCQEGMVGIEDEYGTIAVGPNPTSDYLSIAFDAFASSDKLNVSVYNMNGQIQFFQPFNGQASIELKNWSNGMYLVNVSTEAGDLVHSSKVIKQ